MEQENFLYKMNAQMATMNKAEKCVASVVIENPWDIINMNMATLADTSGVSEPTVVRFFNGLGFKKFNDFKIHLAQAIAPTAPFRYEPVVRDDSTDEVIKKTCHNSINAIQRAEGDLNSQDIDHAVQAIMRSKWVGILSSGLTEIVALDAEHKFSRLGVRCSTVFRATQQIIMSQNVDKDDLLMIISQSGTTRRLVEVAEKAKQQGCVIVAITAPDSPLASLSDHLIKISPYEHTETVTPLNSRLIHQILINILAASIAIAKGSVCPDQLPALDSWVDNKIQDFDSDNTTKE